MYRQKVVYISGPITGVERYWEPFEQAEDDLTGLGYIPLSPAHLPAGMTEENYMRICFAMIDSADAVLLLPGHQRSRGARLEANYCEYTQKPVVRLHCQEPREVVQAWLRHDLEEVTAK